MEQKAFPLPTLPTLRHRRTEPDVPSDVDELMEHFNDPNWDYDDNSISVTTPLSADSFELDHKHKYASSVNIGQSIGTAPSDFDAESRADSRSEARLNLRSSEVYEEEDSPYAEVRAAVANIDDPSMPVNTFRMWFIGILFTIIISGVNQLFSMRFPSVNVTGLVAQLVALPLGKAMERFLPTTRYRTFGYTWSLNPGPFNVKEHTVITCMSNVVATGVYATAVVNTQQVFFNQYWGAGYAILLCLSTQLIGYAFAGIGRRFLIWPSTMIWPGALVSAALFNTLHRNFGRKETKHLSREKFFMLVALGSFVWFWFPGYIFTALSIFNWVCWIAPQNIVINQLFGYSTGLGMGFLTFDWAMISMIGSPLVIPWWAQVNTFVSFVFFYWILTPALYYSNAFFSKFLPMSATIGFDRTGLPYDPSAVIQNGTFSVELYRAYSPVFVPITLLLAWGTSFAALTAVLVHLWLWYRHDLVRQWRSNVTHQRDIHARLMSIYPEVPSTWYLGVGIVAFVLAVITVEVFDTKLPIWALIISILSAAIFLIPICIIQAITNQSITIQVIAEFIVGYMLPGRPVAMMIFKAFSFVLVNQGLTFLSDMKLGHYMKIPPRTMFVAQTSATVISCLVVVGVQRWMFANIPDICTPDQSARFTCPGVSVFATAALLWGGVGPARLFNAGALYNPILWFFLIGAVLPIPFYYLARRYPTSRWRFVNVPVIFAGINQIPPSTGVNYSAWFATGAVFQYFMRRYHFRWWMRYNYILSAGLDAGLLVAVLVIFFALQLPKGGIQINWWGNTVWQNTLDAMGAPFYTLNPGDTFGPLNWT